MVAKLVVLWMPFDDVRSTDYANNFSKRKDFRKITGNNCSGNLAVTVIKNNGGIKKISLK